MLNNFLLALLFTFKIYAAPKIETDFKVGVDNIQTGNYKKAIEVYQELLKKIDNSYVHYNLGTAYYRNGKLIEALFHLTLASHLNPRDSEINYNLNFLKNNIQSTYPNFKSHDDNISTLRKFLPISMKEVFYILILLSAILIILIIFSKLTSSKLFIPKAILLSCTLLFFLLFIVMNSQNEDFGFISSENSEVYSDTGIESIELFKAKYGEKFYIKNKKNDWLRIVFLDKRQGWIKKKNIISTKTIKN